MAEISREWRNHLCVALTLLAAHGCDAQAPTGTVLRASVDADLSQDAAYLDASNARDKVEETSLSDASMACACDTHGERDFSTETFACGELLHIRTCNGCHWGEWEAQPGDCLCEPGRFGGQEDVVGGTGCEYGKRTEQLVCADDGRSYESVPITDFDGSLRVCEASAIETRQQRGTCRTYEQSRTCLSDCEWSPWQGVEGICYPENSIIGTACGQGGACLCRYPGADTCSGQGVCPKGFQWASGLCPGVGPLCCEPLCDKMKATGVGSSACPIGYIWIENQCAEIRGCVGCEGADCNRVMTYSECHALAAACS